MFSDEAYSAQSPKGGVEMNKPDEYNDLVRFSGSSEAEPMTMILEDNDVVFKVTKIATTSRSLLLSSQSPIVIQVLGKDFNRAKEMLAEYRKTQGVPFS
jgi:hypothetical protein